MALADAVGVGLALGRLQTALGDLGDAGVVFADEEGVPSVHGVPGMHGPHLDEHVPVVGGSHTASVSLGGNDGEAPRSRSYQATAAM